MRDLNYAISRLCHRHREGAFATIDARRRSLALIANQLHELGFRGMKNPANLKPKHVWALVDQWKHEGLATATIKNRLAHVRWLAGKTNNEKLLAKSNEYFNVERRAYVTNTNRSLEFSADRLSAIEDPRIRLSAELQKHFGLRREEALKFVPSVADEGSQITLKGSWTKGGKVRSIPVRTEAQRQLLDRAHQLVGKGSMIPSVRRYVTHVKAFEKAMHGVGLGHTHGARHLYAQQRYRELTGREAPAAGGPSRRSLTKQERVRDDEIRLTISRELGHERMQIIALYVGR